MDDTSTFITDFICKLLKFSVLMDSVSIAGSILSKGQWFSDIIKLYLSGYSKPNIITLLSALNVEFFLCQACIWLSCEGSIFNYKALGFNGLIVVFG